MSAYINGMRSQSIAVSALFVAVFSGAAYFTLNAHSFPAVATKQAEGPAGPGEIAEITGLERSRDGHMLAVVDSNKIISIWDAGNGTSLNTLESNNDEWLGSPAFSPDGSLLATLSSTPNTDQAGHLLLWDPATGKRLASVDDLSWPVRCLSFNPAGTLIAVAGNTTLYLVDASTRAIVQHVEMERVVNGFIRAMEFSPAGDLLATAKHNGKVELWQVPDLNMVRTFSVGPSGRPTSRSPYDAPAAPEARSVTFAHNLPRLAANTSEGTAFVWDLNTGKEIVHYPYGGSVYAPLANSLSFTLDDRWLLTMDQKTNGIRLLDAKRRSATDNLLAMPRNSDLGALNVSPTDGSVAFAYRTFHPGEPGLPSVKFEIWSLQMR